MVAASVASVRARQRLGRTEGGAGERASACLVHHALRCARFDRPAIRLLHSVRRRRPRTAAQAEQRQRKRSCRDARQKYRIPTPSTKTKAGPKSWRYFKKKFSPCMDSALTHAPPPPPLSAPLAPSPTAWGPHNSARGPYKASTRPPPGLGQAPQGSFHSRHTFAQHLSKFTHKLGRRRTTAPPRHAAVSTGHHQHHDVACSGGMTPAAPAAPAATPPPLMPARPCDPRRTARHTRSTATSPAGVFNQGPGKGAAWPAPPTTRQSHTAKPHCKAAAIRSSGRRQCTVARYLVQHALIVVGFARFSVNKPQSFFLHTRRRGARSGVQRRALPGHEEA